MANRLVMSLKSISDHLFQLVYSPSPQTPLLDSINILHIDPEPPGRTWSSLTHTQQDLLQLCMPSINEETCSHKHAHTLTHSHTHAEKAKFKYPNDFSSMCPTHMHNPSIFSLTLICLCINIRGCWGMWGGVCLLISPPIPLRSGLRQTVCCVDSELTHMPPRCHPPAQTECVALHRPLEIFSEMMEDSGTNAVPAGKSIKFPVRWRSTLCLWVAL